MCNMTMLINFKKRKRKRVNLPKTLPKLPNQYKGSLVWGYYSPTTHHNILLQNTRRENQGDNQLTEERM